MITHRLQSACSPGRVAVMRGFARLAGWVVMSMAVIVLVGWTFDLTLLKSVVPGLVAMNPLTAVLFLIAGAGLTLAVREEGSALPVFCGASGIGGALVLLRYFFGLPLAPDRWLFAGSLGDNVMAPTTAFGFVLTGTALVLIRLESGREGRRFEQWIAAMTTLLALLALTGYAYQIERLYRIGTFIAMALHTAGSFLVLALGILCVRPDRGITSRFCSDGPGGMMLRRLLLAIVGVPFVIGWVILRAYRQQQLDAGFGFTVFVVSVVCFVAMMLWRNAASLDREDAARTGAEEELHRIHLGLETAVAERTSDLSRVIATVGDSVGILSRSTEEILGSTSQLAATAMESASSVNETTVTVETVRTMAAASNGQAQRIAASSREAVEISAAGRKAAEAGAAGMERIREEMESLAQRIRSLEEQSQAIGEIISAVDDIAEQTNLLSVNAAIEAASAGEHGKGFAVVAEEVKYLAGQSRESTRQVRAILTDLRDAASAAALTTVQALKVVEKGVRESAEAGAAIVELTERIQRADRTMGEIVESSRQQLSATDQVAQAMGQIREASGHNAEQARALEGSARDLNELGLRLRRVVEQHHRQRKSEPTSSANG